MGRAQRMSAKLVPTSDSVIGPNAATTTDAKMIQLLAEEVPSSVREPHQMRARLRP